MERESSLSGVQTQGRQMNAILDSMDIMDIMPVSILCVFVAKMSLKK